MKQEIKDLMNGKALGFMSIIEEKLNEKVADALEEMKKTVGKKMLTDKLHGDQHKLDHNEDGDIDAEDMKNVRKKGANLDHPMAEDCDDDEDQLDEISKDLAGRYIKQASDDNVSSMNKSGSYHRARKDTKFVKRKEYISTAVNKLTGQAKVPAK